MKAHASLLAIQIVVNSMGYQEQENKRKKTKERKEKKRKGDKECSFFMP